MGEKGSEARSSISGKKIKMKVKKTKKDIEVRATYDTLDLTQVNYSQTQIPNYLNFRFRIIVRSYLTKVFHIHERVSRKTNLLDLYLCIVLHLTERKKSEGLTAVFEFRIRLEHNYYPCLRTPAALLKITFMWSQRHTQLITFCNKS